MGVGNKEWPEGSRTDNTAHVPEGNGPLTFCERPTWVGAGQTITPQSQKALLREKQVPSPQFPLEEGFLQAQLHAWLFAEPPQLSRGKKELSSPLTSRLKPREGEGLAQELS